MINKDAHLYLCEPIIDAHLCLPTTWGQLILVILFSFAHHIVTQYP
jgi:hypothetical protein